jgi:putative lipoic acid-binding regulatory protein
MSKPTDGDGVGAPAHKGQAVPEISYPTDYAFKIIGRQEADFAEYVRQLFSRLMGHEIAPASMSEQPSRRGTYVSVEVRVWLVSEAQRRSIYQQLHGDSRIVLYL